jgi:hypothetical protein
MFPCDKGALHTWGTVILPLGYAHIERWEISALIACTGQRLFPALVSAYGGHVEIWRPALVY